MIRLLVIALIVVVVLLVVVWVQDRRKVAAGQAAAELPRDPLGDLEGAALGGDPAALRAGDVLEYLSERLLVRGTIRLGDPAARAEHLLDASSRRRWLSVPEGSSGGLVLFASYDAAGLEPSHRTLSVLGVEYVRVRHGAAAYVTEGGTGLPRTGRVEFADYRARSEGQEHPERLGLTSFDGGPWTAALGEEIPPGTLTIYPAT
ncbi:MAG: DUF4178 domain-containing protein [Streptosporangiales bacterium]|nr:DUF4178 domain-containing protein [Streptosporangiales bacterium]